MFDPACNKEKKITRILDVSPAAVDICTTPCALHGWFIGDTDETPVFVKFYDSLAADTSEADTPVMTLLIPGTTGATGAGANFFTEFALRTFNTALSVRATTGVADNDTGDPGTNVVIGNFCYTNDSIL